MKSLVLSAITVIGLLPSVASARLGDDLATLKKELLMREFSIETHVKAPVSQIVTYQLDPGPKEMRGKILMKLQFDAQEKLKYAEMWISDDYRKLDDVFAKHYAGRFLVTQMPLADTASIRSLLDELRFREEKSNVTVMGAPKLAKTASTDYLAIIGRAPKAEKSLKKCRYIVTQHKLEGKNWTKIRLEPK